MKFDEGVLDFTNQVEQLDGNWVGNWYLVAMSYLGLWNWRVWFTDGRIQSGHEPMEHLALDRARAVAGVGARVIDVSETFASRRSTTSSRAPGKRFVGVVQVKRGGRVTSCRDCGASRRDGDGPHAPHYNRAGELVDCIGRPLAALRRAS